MLEREAIDGSPERAPHGDGSVRRSSFGIDRLLLF